MTAIIAGPTLDANAACLPPVRSRLKPTSSFRPTEYWPMKTAAGPTVAIGGHRCRHIDEEVARWAIGKFATPAWLDQWMPELTADFGVGHGWADEHGGWIKEEGSWRYRPRKLGECCATLVFKALESNGRPLFDFAGMQKMLHFVTENDLTADHRPSNWRHDLAHAINYLYDIVPNHQDVGAWTMQAMDIWFAGRDCEPENFTVEHLYRLSQEGFADDVPSRARNAWIYSWDDWHEMAQAAISKTNADFKAMVAEIQGLSAENKYVLKNYDGAELKVAFVTCANRQTGAASRWCSYDLCVQLHPKTSPLAGGLQVYRNKKRVVGAGPVDLRPIAYHCKKKAMQNEKARLPNEVKQLSREQWLVPGYAHPWDRCYFFVADETMQSRKAPPGEGVFLKSLTAPNIPTPISRSEVIEIVIHCVDRHRDDPYVPLQT